MKIFPGLAPVFGLLAFLSAAVASSAQTATLSADTATYEPAGGSLTLTSTLTYTGLTPSVYAFSVQLPAGWKFVNQSLGGGLSASAAPAVDDNLLEWAFSGFPANQTSWSFVVSYPSGVSGAQTISVVTAQYRSPIIDLSVTGLTLTRAVPPVPTAPSITSQPESRTVSVGDSVTLSVGASGTDPLSYQWQKGGAVIGGATNSTYTISSAQAGDAGSYTVYITNGVGSATSNAVSLTVNPAAPKPPEIAGQPQSKTVSAGTTATFSVTATGVGPLSYQWRKDAVAILGATSASFTISTARAGDAATYSVMVWNGVGSVTSNGATLIVTASTAAANLVNIATRAYCTTGSGVAIGGFVISGNARKQILIRAVGPTLVKQGIKQSEVLVDPLLELHDAIHPDVKVVINDDWGQNQNAGAIVTTGARIGAFPLDGADTKSAALLLTLDPGVYTFVVRGNGTSSGVVLLEVYDAD